jgi:hypothetical protein
VNQSDWLRKRYKKGKKSGCAPEIGALLLIAMAAAWALQSSIHSAL